MEDTDRVFPVKDNVIFPRNKSNIFFQRIHLEHPCGVKHGGNTLSDHTDAMPSHEVIVLWSLFLIANFGKGEAILLQEGKRLVECIFWKIGII